MRHGGVFVGLLLMVSGQASAQQATAGQSVTKCLIRDGVPGWCAIGSAIRDTKGPTPQPEKTPERPVITLRMLRMLPLLRAQAPAMGPLPDCDARSKISIGPMGQRGVGLVEALLDMSDAVAVGMPQANTAAHYDSIRLDRVIYQRASSGAALQRNSFIRTRSCSDNHHYGLYFLRAYSDGTWQVLNSLGEALPALPRAPQDGDATDPEASIADELTNVLTASKTEAEDPLLGLFDPHVSSARVEYATSDGQGSAFLTRPAPGLRMAYNHVLDDLISVGNDVALNALKFAYDHAQTATGRLWAGIGLLRADDTSRTNEAMAALMRPAASEPYLTDEFFLYIHNATFLRFVTPLGSSQNPIVRHRFIGTLMEIAADNSAPRELRQPAVLLPPLIAALEGDSKLDIRASALAGLCAYFDHTDHSGWSPEPDWPHDMLADSTRLHRCLAAAKAALLDHSG